MYSAETDTRQYFFLLLLPGIGDSGHPGVHLTGGQAGLLGAKLAMGNISSTMRVWNPAFHGAEESFPQVGAGASL